MSNSRWSGIIAGASVCFGCEILLFLLGSGIGLIVLPAELASDSWGQIGIGAAIYIAIVIAISYFIGGFIASRLHQPQQRGEVCFQGLATWGTVCFATVLLSGAAFVQATRSAETQAGALVALEALRKTQPRIVTDLKLLKGKAVTTIDLGLTPKGLVSTAKHEVTSPEASETARKAGSTLAGLSLAAFGAMLIAMIASALGAWAGRPTTVSAVVEHATRPREAA